MNFRATLDNLRAIARKATQDLQTSAIDTRDRREVVRRKRDALRARPADRSDIKTMMTAFIREQRAQYIAKLGANLAPFARNPENIRLDAQRKRLLTIVGVAAPGAEFINAKDADGALCALFGEQLVAAMNTALDDCTFPEAGLSMVERDRELKKLDDQLAELDSELQALIGAANEAGITIQCEDH